MLQDQDARGRVEAKKREVGEVRVQEELPALSHNAERETSRKHHVCCWWEMVHTARVSNLSQRFQILCGHSEKLPCLVPEGISHLLAIFTPLHKEGPPLLIQPEVRSFINQGETKWEWEGIMTRPLLVLPLKVACFVGRSGWPSAFRVCARDTWEGKVLMGLSHPLPTHSASPGLQEPGGLPD